MNRDQRRRSRKYGRSLGFFMRRDRIIFDRMFARLLDVLLIDDLYLDNE